MESPTNNMTPETHDNAGETWTQGDPSATQSLTSPSFLNGQPQEGGGSYWTKAELVSLSWIHKLPGEIRNRVYDMIIDSLWLGRYIYSPGFKYNKGRIGIVVFDQLRRSTLFADWFDAISAYSSRGYREAWYRTHRSEMTWAMDGLFEVINPEFKDELKARRYTTRVLELGAGSWYEYDPQQWRRDIRDNHEDWKNFIHLSFDYLSPLALDEDDEADFDNGVDNDNPHNDIFEGREEAFLHLCSSIASDLNPNTLTLWMRLSEDEIHEILKGQSDDSIAVTSAIRSLNVRYQFSIYLFVLKNDITPSTPEEYARMCMSYTRQLQDHLMPYSLRKLEETSPE